MSVSVILATFNNAETLPRAIASALTPARVPLEVVVIDDGSTDDTAALVGRLAAEDPRIRLVRAPVNGGAAKARGLGLAVATGEWMAILDADDAWRPGRVDAMLDAARRHDAQVVCDNFTIWDPGAEREVRRAWEPGFDERVVGLHDYLLHCRPTSFQWSIFKPMVRRDFMARHDIGYWPHMRTGQDLFFLGDLLVHGARMVLLRDDYYIYTGRQGELSGVRNRANRTSHVFSRIADGVGEFARRYAVRMTPAELAETLHLERQFRVVHRSNLAREKRQAGNWPGYLADLADRELLTFLVAKRLRLRQVARQRRRHMERRAPAR